MFDLGDLMGSFTRHPEALRKQLPLLTVLLGLYAAQSLVFSVLQYSAPIVMRDAGFSLGQIGFMAVFALPWALKILWAPLVDQYGHTKHWILACQLVLIALFFAASFLDTATHPFLIIGLLLVLITAAATQDIATDAMGVHATHVGNRQIASGSSTVGGYFGFLVGGGVWLYVFATLGWQPAMIILALIVAALTIPTFLLPAGRAATAAESGENAKLKLLAAFRSPLILKGFMLLLVWHGGVRLSMGLTGTMLFDAGLGMEQIAAMRGVGGMLVGLIAALGTIELIRRSTLRLATCVAAAAVSSTCFAHAAWAFSSSDNLSLLISIHLSLLGAIGTSFVVIYAILMDLCAPKQVATDFSVLQAFDVVVLVLSSISGGLLAQHFGYGLSFTLSALLVVAGLPIALRLLRKTETQMEKKSHETATL